MNARDDRPLVAGVGISHPDRVVYPAPPLTKVDVARYYASIAGWIVPHVRGRPLTLVRCPEGIGGDCFFMKHSQVWAPSALRRVRIQEKTKVGEYLIADGLPGIVGLVQRAARCPGPTSWRRRARCGACSRRSTWRRS